MKGLHLPMNIAFWLVAALLMAIVGYLILNKGVLGFIKAPLNFLNPFS